MLLFVVRGPGAPFDIAWWRPGAGLYVSAPDSGTQRIGLGPLGIALRRATAALVLMGPRGPTETILAGLPEQACSSDLGSCLSSGGLLVALPPGGTSPWLGSRDGLAQSLGVMLRVVVAQERSPKKIRMLKGGQMQGFYRLVLIR